MNKLKAIFFSGAGAATPLGDFGLLFLRVCIGLFMTIGHGYGKMFPDGGFGPTKGFIDNTESLGFPMPVLFAWCAALTEFLGGILIALGLATRPAAFFLAINMGVAAFIAHADAPFFGKPPNKEYALLFFVPAIMLICTGAGRYSVDTLLRRK